MKVPNMAAKEKRTREPSARQTRSATVPEDDAEQALKEILAAWAKPSVRPNIAQSAGGGSRRAAINKARPLG